jgi:hypothetical protein
MIATLSAVTREGLRRFMRVMRIVAVIGVGVGAVYGGAIAGPGARSLLVSLLISVPIGVIAALLTVRRPMLRRTGISRRNAAEPGTPLHEDPRQLGTMDRQAGTGFCPSHAGMRIFRLAGCRKLRI